jgi:hypothetical protein
MVGPIPSEQFPIGSSGSAAPVSARKALIATVAHVIATVAHVIATVAHVIATVAHVIATVAHVIATVAHVIAGVAKQSTRINGWRLLRYARNDPRFVTRSGSAPNV